MINEKKYYDARMVTFLENQNDCYAILQLRKDKECALELFSSMEELQRMGKKPEINHYEVVHLGNLPVHFVSQEQIPMLLESLFEIYNINRPEDFTGHSLSVSDVIALKMQGHISCYYVDSIGFQQLTDFIRKKETMTKREKIKERFDELGLGNLSASEVAQHFAVRKNGEIVLCEQIPCRDCIFGSGIWSCDKEKKIWLESEAVQDELALEKKDEEKDLVSKHKLFISCPTKGRTEENIKKSFEILKRTAEAYSGEALEVVNPYEPKIFENDADHIRSLGDSIKLMADADYFITIEKFWEHTECGVENNIAGEYGVKRMLAMTEFVAPDVFDKSENMVRNPYYNG